MELARDASKYDYNFYYWKKMYMIRHCLNGYGRMIYYQVHGHQNFKNSWNESLKVYNPYLSPEKNEIIAMYEGHFKHGKPEGYARIMNYTGEVDVGLYAAGNPYGNHM